mmetsp:Transcript_27354/g.44524  ORF Transcript_27354/g.44524 Transcript_27354/m.44524 type:complete len:604 (-) Transcript_27354:816-2627(-)|eukprot:CAMPEP_0184660924 /NCGR_PEP_ID=MMETSP0308-20130426/36036_1 /TAXON_ID=38269 /ORGANISM="Gloeochaete witrockiana, Strain SAG 46.84" /LENGTH=603 /DNA_ID=CAMNT_0027101861 /DNA_START=86 /DNA_END=1897 /DNA_ORIENTATION=+
MASARVSLAPGAITGMPGKQSLAPLKRMSMAPGVVSQGKISMGSRASSVGLTRPSISFSKSSNAVKQDPRPLTDKQFQANATRIVIKYLTEHGYDHPISPKIMGAPTGKDFFNILQFLLHQIDPNLKFGEKLADEVPAIFKKLRYPFSISKTSLHAAGSPHSWPALLGSLVWLVELLNYEEEVEAKEQEEQFDMTPEKIFYEYLAKAYQHFLAGDDNIQYLDDELASSFDCKNEGVLQEIDHLNKTGDKLTKELDSLKNTPAPLIVIQNKKVDFISDLEKIKKLIVQMQEHKRVVQAKIDERKQEQQQRENELQVALQERSTLQERLLQQEANAVDLQRMTQERAVLEENLQAVTSLKEAAERITYQTEIQIAKKVEEVEKSLVAYRSTADRLKVLPATAKNANGIAFDLRLNLNAPASRPDQLLSADVKSVIEPALHKLKESFQSKMRASQEQLLVFKERLDHLDEQRVEKAEELVSTEAKLKKLEAQHRQEKEALAEQLKGIVTETHTLEEDIARQKAASTQTIAQSQQIIEALNNEHESLQARYNMEKASINDKFVGFLEMVIDHKQSLQTSLSDLATQCDSSRAQICDLRTVIERLAAL